MSKKKTIGTGLDDYLSSNVNTSRCHTCNHYPELLGEIEQFLIRKRDGLTHLPTGSVNGRPSLFEYLRTEHGYRLTSATMMRHVAHVKETL